MHLIKSSCLFRSTRLVISSVLLLIYVATPCLAVSVVVLCILSTNGSHSLVSYLNISSDMSFNSGLIGLILVTSICCKGVADEQIGKFSVCKAKELVGILCIESIHYLTLFT